MGKTEEGYFGGFRGILGTEVDPSRPSTLGAAEEEVVVSPPTRPRAGETPLSVKSTYEQKNDFIYVTELPLDVTPGDGWAVKGSFLNLTIKRCLTGPRITLVS